MREVQIQVPETSHLYVQEVLISYGKKKVLKKMAPNILDMALQAGQEIMRGKKIKSVAKNAMSQMARTVTRSTRQTFEDELARHAT